MLLILRCAAPLLQVPIKNYKYCRCSAPFNQLQINKPQSGEIFVDLARYLSREVRSTEI